MARLLRKALRVFLDHDPSFCDMHDDPRAKASARDYLAEIRQHLTQRFGEKRVAILDGGCQAGRLLIPLAEDGHRMIGIDTSAFALRRARRHAKERGLSIQLYRGDLASLRRWIRPASVDAAICAEVLYLCRDHDALLGLLAESVAPGGLLFVSHRPQLYYVTMAVRAGRLDLAEWMLTHAEGPNTEGDYHNWQTPEQLAACYRRHGLRTLACHALDSLVVSFDRAAVSEACVARFLSEAQIGESTIRIPGYLLVAAQRPLPGEPLDG